MSNRGWFLIGAVAACSAAAAFTLPSALAAPATDTRGYVDSTARCAAPYSAVVFGSTATSRVAICETPNGGYEYRGVRVRDGAKLIKTAQKSGNTFTVDNNGITYTVSEDSLILAEGSRVIRDEAMLDFHEASASSPGMSPPAASSAPTTSQKPLPPPLPAEVGHDDS
ncbi:hypothetical protein AU198_24530 [Mycobacterium sp. GA-1199]|uniref:hypothetical protein n=1 Tax=Mycobacterium sp. GA-1199 TaxID=1772287 RepID=UPI0007493204|nr:hypothetical protein [Mycobacterium sp. GA-1199]KUI47496.1 hypothetical protein AU198_24530 [Mycobacterium sp. GA-1199]UUO04006.1 hypothetical protein M4D79_09045 [Mycolicibacterium novocastrense]